MALRDRNRLISTLAATTAMLAVAGHASLCDAAAVRVVVRALNGEPLEGVAVYAVPRSPEPAPSTRPTAVMDQAHKAFVPHVLVVQTGTSVLFPNNDTVSHHVYSFSRAKVFELPLYKGNAHPPLLFDKPGLVVLGCNIHDSMLGYILVVDTPHFGTTTATGEATLDGLPAGDYRVEIWTPRVKPSDLPVALPVTVAVDETRSVAFALSGKLLPQDDAGGSSLPWERY